MSGLVDSLERKCDGWEDVMPRKMLLGTFKIENVVGALRGGLSDLFLFDLARMRLEIVCNMDTEIAINRFGE